MAFAPMSVTLTLDDEIDISRGDVLTVEPAFVGQRFEAELVWMDERPLDPGRVYLLKHGTRTVTAEVNHALVLNQIGTVQVSTARPLVFDRYAENRGTGSFILIDPGDAVHVRRRHDHRSASRVRSKRRARRSRSPNGWRTSRGARRRTRKRPKLCARRSRRCSHDPRFGLGIRDSELATRRGDQSSERSRGAQTPCITSSFQAECVVLTHMLREVRPDIPVLFLDTFHHFAQTLAYRDELTRAVGAEPDQPAGDRRRASGCGRPRAPRRAASATRWSRCSRRSKATTRGSRRCAAISRRRARTCRKWSRSSCPAARRSRASRRSPAGPRATCGRTRRTHDIPLLPLYELGYTSIGCEPCTALPLDPDNPRSGRWQGQKLECGIHIQAK